MIKTNVANIQNKIEEICSNCDRDPKEITLIAVSKKKSFESILEAHSNGIRNFGENKVQELKQKYEICTEDLTWHFVGHLQTNKVKDVVKIADFIHSVDSKKLAGEINKRTLNLNKIQNILLEINTSREDSKYGLIDECQILELAEYCTSLSNLNLVGLMTMAPYTNDESIIRNSFKSLKNIFIKLNDAGFKLSELSMGMTNDFEIAIEEGATMIRIGTAIFGDRL